MKKAIRLSAWILVLVMLATVFSGCGNNNTGKLMDDDGNVIVRITVPENGTEGQVNALIRGYQALGKKVAFKKEIVIGDYTTKLITQASAGTAPDIIWLSDVQTSGMASKGLLAELNAYYEKEKFDTSNVYESMLLTGQYKGKQYMMPRDYNHIVTFYNKAIFKEAGVAEPKFGWTWEEFLETAYKLPKKSGSVYTQRACQAWLTWGATAPIIILGLGGTLTDPFPNGTKANFNTPGTVQALTTIKKLVDDGVFVNDYSNDTGDFNSGKIGMVFNTRSSLTGFCSSIGTENVGVTTFPILPEQHIVGSGTSGYAIVNSSKCKDEAAGFVFYSISEEGQRLFSETGNCVPVLKSMADDDVWKNSVKGIPSEPFLDSPECDILQPSITVGSDKGSVRFDDCWSNALSGLLTNIMSPAEAAEFGQKDLESAFERE